MFSGLSIDERRKLLFKMLNFIVSSPIAYEMAVVNRKAEPQKNRLLQAADFICSMELLKIKKNENRLSKSEKQFFYKPQELKKTFFKAIDKKQLGK